MTWCRLAGPGNRADRLGEPGELRAGLEPESEDAGDEGRHRDELVQTVIG